MGRFRRSWNHKMGTGCYLCFRAKLTSKGKQDLLNHHYTANNVMLNLFKAEVVVFAVISYSTFLVLEVLLNQTWLWYLLTDLIKNYDIMPDKSSPLGTNEL